MMRQMNRGTTLTTPPPPVGAVVLDEARQTVSVGAQYNSQQENVVSLTN